MAEFELYDFAFVVESHAERVAAEMVKDADDVTMGDIRRAVKHLNDAIEDNDAHGTAVYARVLKVLTK